MKRKSLVTLLMVSVMLLLAFICHAETSANLEIVEDNQGTWVYFPEELNDDNYSNDDTANLMSVSNVYSSAPEIDGYDMRINPLIDDDGNPSHVMRVRISSPYEIEESAKEHGFIYALTKELEENEEELTLETTSESFGKTVTYGKTPFLSDDEYTIYSGNINVLEPNFTLYLTVRTYAVYEVDGEEVVAYGNLDYKSYYRMAKAIVEEYGEEFSDYLTENVEIAKANVLTFAEEAEISSECDGSLIGTDICAIKFVPDDSGFYTLSINTSSGVTRELLDEFGVEYDGVKINDDTIYTAYLFEEGNTYYIRMNGAMGSSYRIDTTPCLDGALIYDFANDTEGFTCGDGATGTIEDGKLKVSIDKSFSFTKAYVQNNNLSLDLFNYSRLIIRMKNTTNSTKLSGVVSIDLEYDGSAINYSLDSSMPANMTEFENIEFDFTTRYGDVGALKLTFGQILSSLTGDIYIDSISILPMPEALYWDFDETIEDWSYTEQIDSAVVVDGALVLDMLGVVPGTAPAIVSPGYSAYDYNKYNEIRIMLMNQSNATSIHLYYSTLSQSSFSEDKKVVIPIEADSEEFIEYTIDLSKQDSFTDSLYGIMISIPGYGTAEIDYIALYKAPHEDVVWDFEDGSLQGFYSSNNRHTLSVDDGKMSIVVANLNNGALYTPDLELSTDDYKYLVLGVNSASSTSNFEVYFTTSTTNGYSENDTTNKIIHKQVIQISESATFTEYVIDLSHAPNGWTSAYEGTLNELMTAFTTPGTYELDYVILR